ncbi:MULTISPECIES: FAD-dependent oxidoreductase [Streptomyces]|uniref:Pyridine nucleotide-disulfide oxidoreductase n=3 Tax=Streptomyces TaxID=1883 RepID=A0A5P2BIW4_STRVZ|nr:MULTISPECIES: FAD-dependent oxidoreductase [Streptomyces]NEA03183.1 oxidoreductase [Streptomyces sp. SID10116]MYY82649.1 FAD-dependent oxidoreductase [Streptomyces sp. SID335]MYZ15859.1 FAD-dependent oxidoreductase [Streptomyces sp. SID337]NEB48137.1 oxidoreductase [Streptomyces sp. SID339]QES30354.1 pyridine nucleotide-disulfide oxidoreductase [Streptomyces venezuelae]
MTDRTQPDSVVVVGAGQGGYQTAASLREHGYEGSITLISAEDALPYERPPLSKAYLKGEADEAMLWLRPATYYVRQSIDLVSGTVTEIDPAARSVRLADGSAYTYGHLVLATGATPRTLDVPGKELRGVHTLRTAQDAVALQSSLTGARRAVVVGAGFIGLEFAAVAREAGVEVTVVEALDRPLARVVSAPTAEHFTWLHRSNGTELLFGRGVKALHGDGRSNVTAVELADGSRLPADLVLIGVGVTPRTELAAAAGLEVDGGITVDAHLRTSDPHISAIGDCAVFPLARSGSRRRLESVQNAVGHAQAVAGRLAGSPRAYDELPWFWSDQFTTTVQIAGFNEGHETEVVLGTDPDAFSVLLFRGDDLQAVESVNRPADHLAARRLLAQGTDLTPTEATAPGFSLRTYLRSLAERGTEAPVAL